MTLLTQNYVPETYDEVFRHYYPQIVGMVKMFKVSPNRREDVAMTILSKFIERDMLPKFDPEFIGGNGQPVPFQTFITGFVASYVRYHRDREITEISRELQLVDTEVEVDVNLVLPWLDTREVHTDDVTSVEVPITIALIREHLAKIPASDDIHSLSLLFEFMLTQIQEYGRVLVKELADLYGVSVTSMQKWIRSVRDEIRIVIA